MPFLLRTTFFAAGRTTLIFTVAFLPFSVFAVMVTVPAFSALTLPPSVTVATFSLLLVQVTLWLAGFGVTVALSVNVLPAVSFTVPVLLSCTSVSGA